MLRVRASVCVSVCVCVCGCHFRSLGDFCRLVGFCVRPRSRTFRDLGAFRGLGVGFSGDERVKDGSEPESKSGRA